MVEHQLLALIPTIQKPNIFDQIPNGFLTKWRPFVWISNGWSSGFQIPFQIWNICNPTSFRSFKIQTRSHLRSNDPYCIAFSYQKTITNSSKIGNCLANLILGRLQFESHPCRLTLFILHPVKLDPEIGVVLLQDVYFVVAILNLERDMAGLEYSGDLITGQI